MNKGRENKPHIGILGRRNHGKSTLINALAGQEIAIVSDVPGTTTDPVKKSMEMDGLGPVIFVDTAGIDDLGALGRKRISRTLQVISTLDMAILLVAHNIFGDFERDLIKELKRFDVPYFILYNKSDIEPLRPELKEIIKQETGVAVVEFTATGASGLPDVIQEINRTIPEVSRKQQSLLGGLIEPGDMVLLVTPIDSEAPVGRMILPQVQVIRDVLDNDGIALVLKETGLTAGLGRLSQPPRLVVTDSQAFAKVAAAVPPDIPLTSFSILLARQKGPFEKYLEGTKHITGLRDADKVLILESCTHHVSCDDIGRIKIPDWIRKHTGKNPEFVTVSGLDAIPGDLNDYSLAVQCGGCVFTGKQVSGRLQALIEAGVPVTNYGMAIAYVHGIFDRVTAPFFNTKHTMTILQDQHPSI